jgi:F-type H+-transporting ATPase subunit epsilon
MAASFNFEIYTPYRLFFSGFVQAIVLTLVDGEVAVYANHAPFTAPVIPCLLKIKDAKGNWRTAFTSEGFLEVRNSKTILVSDTAEWPEEIDYERARDAKERAEKSLEGSIFKFEINSASASLKRADMRIKIREEGNQGLGTGD